MNIILFGPPGAGKSTLGNKLVDTYGFIRISTGDIIRQHIKEDTALGREAKSYIENGTLVPDALAMGLVRSYVGEKTTGFLFDGFPRTQVQAVYLDSILKIHSVINLVSNDDELVARLLRRGRSDDSEELIRTRLGVYHEQSQPCLEYLKPLVTNVNGVGTVDEVFARLLSVVDEVALHV